MKKISLLVFFSLILNLVSCSSSDDNDGGNSNGVKVAAFREKMYEDGALTSDYNFVFNYQDEKVINVVRGNTRIEFTYSGNKIISSSMFTNDVLT